MEFPDSSGTPLGIQQGAHLSGTCTLGDPLMYNLFSLFTKLIQNQRPPIIAMTSVWSLRYTSIERKKVLNHTIMRLFYP